MDFSYRGNINTVLPFDLKSVLLQVTRASRVLLRYQRLHRVVLYVPKYHAGPALTEHNSAAPRLSGLMN